MKFVKKTTSSKPGKQRKSFFKAPLHAKRKHVSAPLSKDLRSKHGQRSASVRAGDKVKVLRGQYQGAVGKVDRTDVDRKRVYIVGVEVTKKNGAKVQYPIHPSNVMITDLVLSDKRRMKRDTSKETKKQDSPAAKPAKK